MQRNFAPLKFEVIHWGTKQVAFILGEKEERITVIIGSSTHVKEKLFEVLVISSSSGMDPANAVKKMLDRKSNDHWI